MVHLVAALAALRVVPAAATLSAIRRRWSRSPTRARHDRQERPTLNAKPENRPRARLGDRGRPWVRSVPEPIRRNGFRAARVLGDWYPLLLVPALYVELAVLNRAVYAGRYFDPLILAVEEAVFGGQPSRVFAAVVPSPLISELLHGAYISYYLIIYGPPMLLYLAGRRDDFRRAVFALMLTFFVHYLFFIYFPVQGPRYLFSTPVAEVAQGPIYRFTHAVLEAGSSQGAAFPSSHVAVAVVQTVLVLRLLPRLFPVLAVLTVGLALGAVQGGFHYATDALAGLGLGLALVAVAPAVRRRV